MDAMPISLGEALCAALSDLPKESVVFSEGVKQQLGCRLGRAVVDGVHQVTLLWFCRESYQSPLSRSEQEQTVIDLLPVS